MICGREFLSADDTNPEMRERMKSNLKIIAGMTYRLASRKKVMQSEISRLRANPVRKNFDFLVFQLPISSIAGHPIIFLSIEALILGIFNKSD